MPWYLPLIRAVAAVALAVVVTFSPDHSAPLGYIVLGTYGVIGGLVQGWTGLRSTGTQRMLLVAQGVVLLIAAVLAFVFVSGGVPFFVFLLSATAVVTGALELVTGLRSSGPVRRDRIFAGALTLLLAVAVLLVPPGFDQPLGGVEAITGSLTASTIVVGLLGAYLAVLGVYLAIAAFSLKWVSSPAAPAGT